MPEIKFAAFTSKAVVETTVFFFRFMITKSLNIRNIFTQDSEIQLKIIFNLELRIFKTLFYRVSLGNEPT